MDGGLAGPTGDGDAPRASVARESAPPSSGAEAPSGRNGPAAEKPSGRSGPAAEKPSGGSGPGPPGAASNRTGAAGTGSSSDDRRPSLASQARAFWERTAPLRQRLGEFLRGVLDALRESAPVSGSTSPPPAGPLTERLDTLAPIRVSGQGRAFNFHIYARCHWSSEDLHREALLSYAHHCMPDAVRRLTRLATQHAGSFAAFRAPELEVRLQQALTETGPWRYVRGDKAVTCQPHVWVGVDDRVRKVAQPYWEKLVKLDCKFAVDQRQAEYDNRLGRQRPAGADSHTNGAAPGAATPTGGEDRDSELRQLVAELRAVAQRLEGLVNRTPRDADTG